jgi:hypothetical protein
MTCCSVWARSSGWTKTGSDVCSLPCTYSSNRLAVCLATPLGSAAGGSEGMPKVGRRADG